MAKLTISNVSVSNIADTSAVVSWDTNKPSDAAVDYGPTAAYGHQATVLAPPLVTRHNVTIIGLQPGTPYHYCAKSGIRSSPDATFTTTGTGGPPPPAGDTTAPTVAITAPRDGAIVKGVVPITVIAADDTAVAQVMFYCDGQFVAASTSAPFAKSIDTRTMAEGPHVLTASAVDAATNLANSAPITITVQNTPQPPPGFFVALYGKPTGDGSITRPWDIITGLNHPAAVVPGTTLWLRAGMYYRPAPPLVPGKQFRPGGYISRIKGQPGRMIDVRAYPGERVGIDSNTVKGVGLDCQSEYVNYRDLEFLNSDPRRIAPIAGSIVAVDWRKNGVDVHAGPQNNFINCVIHDCGSGIGFWEEAIDSTIYGLVSFNNGWVGPDRGHGHGAYIQNETGTKTIRHCLSWDNFATGMKAYATHAAAEGVHFEGCITIENGLPEALGDTPPSKTRNEGILSGTEQLPQADIRFEDCFQYTRPGTTASGPLRAGIGSKAADVTYLRCTVASGTVLAVTNWDDVTITDCELFVRSMAVNIQFASGQDASRYVIDRNKWHDNSPIGAGARRPFGLTGVVNANGAGKLSFNEWKTPYGWEANGSYDAGPHTGVRTFVHPNEYRDQYDKRAAIIGILNFDNAATVPVDVSNCLQVGDAWHLQSIEDFFGTPAASGIYDGTPIIVPMTGGAVVGPVGFAPAIPSAAPECFGGVLFVD